MKCQQTLLLEAPVEFCSIVFNLHSSLARSAMYSTS